MNLFARFQSTPEPAPKPTPPSPSPTPAPKQPTSVDWRRRFMPVATPAPRQDGYSHEQAQIICAFQAQLERAGTWDVEALRITLRCVRTAPYFCPLWAVEAFYRAAAVVPAAA
jgi:hypothetical protein